LFSVLTILYKAMSDLEFGISTSGAVCKEVAGQCEFVAWLCCVQDLLIIYVLFDLL